MASTKIDKDICVLTAASLLSPLQYRMVGIFLNDDGGRLYVTKECEAVKNPHLHCILLEA
jgi:hypothetical protein